MATKGYNLEQTGEQVQAALNKAINLGPATEEADGLMTAADKASLENLNTEINDKVDKVTGKGLSTNDFTNEDKSKLDTAYQVPSTGIPAADMSSGVQTSLGKANSAVQPADLVPITEKIPAQASAQNQLADKAFVNSSISTASADFKGTYDSLSELQAVTADKNDYGYVVSTDEAGNTVYSRYKYNGSSWVFEYDLNNSSFTAAEWAAIQSGITAPLVQKLGALPTNADLQSALSGKQATLVSGTNIKTVDGQSILGSGNLSVSDPNAVKVTAQTWTDAQKTQARTNIGAYAKPSGGIPKTDLASGVQGSLDLADSAIQARPSGEVDPTITPAEYATQEELAQLEAKVDGTPRNYTPGYGLKSDGTLQESSYCGVTDYIPYTPGNDVLWRFSNQNRSYFLLFYRSDKTLISGSDFTAQYNSTNQGRLIAKASINSYAPNAAYIRASFNLDYADAQIKVGDTVVWTPQEQGLSLQEQIDTLAEFNEDIFADCLVEQIKLVGVAYQGKYIYKGDHSINDSASNGSFVVPVTTGDRILVRGTVNAFANYSVIGFTDNLTNGYTAGVKNLLTVDSNTNPYTYTYLFTATANGYLIAWTTKQGYGDSLYVEMFRIKERQKEVFDRYLPETVKLQTFGDSITDNFWGDKSSWVSYVPDNIKNTTLTIVNSAVGGASIGGTGSYNIPNQIENGYTRTDGSVASPLDSTADVVVIFAGTNDWAAGQSLESVKGNLATSFQYIYEHSKAKVLFCTPLQRYNDADQARDTDENGVPINPLGMTLRELCDELIEVCKRFSVLVLDLNAEANINRYNISDYSLDGLHPQRWGDAYVSRLICEKIKAMLRYDLQ